MNTQALPAMLTTAMAATSKSTTFFSLTGFTVVTSAMDVSTENLFTFSNNLKLCLHFTSEDCNAISFTCNAYRLQKGEWIYAGKHTFNQQGISTTIAVDWHQVLQANRE